MARARVLVVDDGGVTSAALIGAVSRHFLDVETATDWADALDLLREARGQGGPFDYVVVDPHGEADLQTIVDQLAQHKLDTPVVLAMRQGDRNGAIDGMKAGIHDRLVQPFEATQVRVVFAQAQRSRGPNTSPVGKRLPHPPRKGDVIVGAGPWLQELFDQLAMVAPTDGAVAIYGESGTGKELVARTIHRLSRRATAPFIVVNCASIPAGLLEDELFGHVRGAFTDASSDRDGLFAAADGGTIFLDEIGEMPLALQAKLLQVLQSKEFRRVGDNAVRRVDVRVITATNRNLEAAVDSGEFREDLFYRINVLPVSLPPLRERREDIPLLAQHFLIAHRDKVDKPIEGFSAQAMAVLCAYDFPGNVRELENKVHQALVLSSGPTIQPADFKLSSLSGRRGPSVVDIDRPFQELKRELIDAFERRYARLLIEAHCGNIAAAARSAGIDRKNLWAMLKKYDIDAAEVRRRRPHG